MKTSREDIAMTTSPAYNAVQSIVKWVTRRYVLNYNIMFIVNLKKHQEPTEFTSQ